MNIHFTRQPDTLGICGDPSPAFPRRLRAAIARAAQAGCYELTVDLTAIGVIDSSVLGAFADAVRTSRPLGVSLTFVFPERARRIAAIAGLKLAA